MDLSGPTAKRARVGLGESTLPAPRACPPSQQFAEVVVGSSAQQVQEDSGLRKGRTSSSR